MDALQLDPSAALGDAAFGAEHAMVEWMILHLFHHGASRLEYRTIDGEFRVAQIMDGEACEYPQPPGCMSRPTIDYLKSIFGMREGMDVAERELRAGESLARARCNIDEYNQNATITIVRPFPASTDLLPILQRFFRVRAGRLGAISRLKYVAGSALWKLKEWANHAMNPSRRSRL